MAKPIEATPVLKGKDAEIFLKDLLEVEEKMKDPKYRAKIAKRLKECEKLYQHFESKRITPSEYIRNIGK